LNFLSSNSWRKVSLQFLTLLHHNRLMLQVLPTPAKSWAPALSAMGLAALAAYGVVSWFLQIQSLSAPASLAPVAQTSSASAAVAIDTGRVAQALGAPLAADAGSGTEAVAAYQWTLLGVVAGASGKGSALLSVDGQAPKAYLPGQTVAPGWVLHSVGHRLARLAPAGQDSASVTLELPKLSQ
jgi:general secretion pathway protein C